MTIEYYTEEEFAKQVFDLYGVKISTSGGNLFIRPFIENPEPMMVIDDDTAASDFNAMIEKFSKKFAFAKPLNQINKDHLLHFNVKSIEDGTWMILLSYEKPLSDFTDEDIINTCEECMRENKYSELHVLDFSTKTTMFFGRNLN